MIATRDRRCILDGYYFFLEGENRRIPVVIQQVKLDENVIRTLMVSRHPHILPLYGHHATEISSWLIAPRIPEGTLEDCYRRCPSIPDPEMRQRLVMEVGLGLTYIHQQGLAHCDIKASNVLVTHVHTEDGVKMRALLSGFGCARDCTTTTDIGASYIEPEHLNWQAWERVAPEVLLTAYVNDFQKELRLTRVDMNGKLLQAADVWSWAMLVLEVYSEHVPYHHVEDVQLEQHIKQYNLPSSTVRSLMTRNGLTECMSDTLNRCWNHHPAQRPTMQAILDEHGTQPTHYSPAPGSVPPPTNDHTPEGPPILFYARATRRSICSVKLLQEISEECLPILMFETGDIIAVTIRPSCDEGWWMGTIYKQASAPTAPIPSRTSAGDMDPLPDDSVPKHYPHVSETGWFPADTHIKPIAPPAQVHTPSGIFYVEATRSWDAQTLFEPMGLINHWAGDVLAITDAPHDGNWTALNMTMGDRRGYWVPRDMVQTGWLEMDGFEVEQERRARSALTSQ